MREQEGRNKLSRFFAINTKTAVSNFYNKVTTDLPLCRVDCAVIDTLKKKVFIVLIHSLQSVSVFQNCLTLFHSFSIFNK